MPVLYIDSDVGSEASLKDVEEAVRRLDGSRHTLMTVVLPSGKSLTIGGGPSRFVTEVAEDERNRWAAVDPTAGEEPVDLRVGGSLADYPARLCVDMETVLSAVRAFISDDGARSKSVTWSVET